MMDKLIFIFGEQDKRIELIKYLKEVGYKINDHILALNALDPKIGDYRFDQEATLDIVEITQAEIEQLCSLAIVITSDKFLYKTSMCIKDCWNLDIPIIVYAEAEVRDPWVIYYCSSVAIDQHSLVECIEELGT